jgi:glycosyltransferase involved in cell wall biosynthesis
VKDSSRHSRDARISFSDVSIILRVRNAPRHLELAVDSIRRTAPDAQVVIVDNESSDDTASVAVRLGDAVLVQAGPVGRLTRAGVERASGRIVVVMDVDQRLLHGTIYSACETLANYEAVVIPERPASRRGRWTSILKVERQWAEASGLGYPRVFWRAAYLKYEQPSKLVFGEDQFVSKQIKRIGISRIPILHDELASPWLLLKKYYRYGTKQVSGRGSLVSPLGALRAYAGGVRRLPLSSLLLVPFVVPLKLAKAGFFYAGSLAGHWRIPHLA